MKLFWFLFAVFVITCEGSTLDCYTYTVNSIDPIPTDATPQLQTCGSNFTSCATLSWTSTLSNNEEVKFQEGLCATPSVCRDFCRAVFADDLLGPITRQCQHQCCNSAGCNYIRQ